MTLCLAASSQRGGASSSVRTTELLRRSVQATWSQQVQISRNIWIGGGAILLPGVNVGDDAVIGAGSVVTRNVAAGATVTGNPAAARAR